MTRGATRAARAASVRIRSGIPDAIIARRLAAGARPESNGSMTSHPDLSTAPEPTVALGGAGLAPADVVAVAREDARVELSDAALRDMAASRALIESLAHDTRPHYGVSTGFGALATVQIPVEKRRQLQRGLIRSHAAGTGPEVEREVVRALMLLRLDTLATGRTGVRPEVARAYASLLNAGITPIVHEYGSLGCSGDLSPLAHCALAVMGEGRVRDASGAPLEAADALAEAGIEPVVLEEKEGLALINGTDGMLGMLLLALHDLEALLRVADVAAAASVEALLGTDTVFAADLHALRPHPGQAASAANIARILRDSDLISRPGAGEFTRVQDAYSLRCAPQVHGAARDTAAHAASVARVELASAIDNPVVTPDGRVESNGNFHGAPVGYVLDFLAIAAADVASMSERRTDRFLDVARSHGLPPFLADDPGLDSGLMIAQYTAAGIVSELKRLAVPASVDSIPSSAMQEDHVSMGWAAGRKLRRAIDGLSRVLAIELLASTRALDFRLAAGAGRPGPATEAVHALFRTDIAAPGPDVFTSPDIDRAVAHVQSGRVLAAVEEAVGALA
jgi:histidine ammonia-lyase